MLIDSERKTINVWWMRETTPGNFGDILTPWLIRRICKYRPRYSWQRILTPENDGVEVFDGYWEDTLLGVGSILNFTSKETTIWGSGIIRQDTQVSPEATYLAVRGPLSREAVQNSGAACPAVFGDPALLLPRYYPRNASPKYSVGFFPHYVDYKQVVGWYGADIDHVKIIDPLNNNIIKVLDDLFQCEHIISSSLHGVIVANAYGIPVTWVKFSDKLYGDDSKFHDHFAALGMKKIYTPFYEKIPLNDLHKLGYFLSPEFDTTPLLKAFPVQV